jgi:phosphomethylpyrimidine synthase
MTTPFVVRNRSREVEGVVFGGDAPARLGLLLGVTVGATTLELETAKLSACQNLGVSTVTDLSTDGTGQFRRVLLHSFRGAVGTLPVYDAHHRFRRGTDALTAVFSALEDQANEGVDFFSVHASLSRDLARRALNGSTGRTIPLTSRGGAMMAELMRRHSVENPLLERWSEVVALCKEYEITLSLVGSLRPGSISDSFEETHIDELRIQSALAAEANAAGVSTFVELLNHLPLADIPEYMQLARRLFPHSIIGALGPTPSDVAVGFDDVAGAIGATVAVQNGARWINCLTAAEHISLPRIEQTIQAVRYFRVALHIATVAHDRGSAEDRRLARARAVNDWDAMRDAALFPDVASQAISSSYTEGGPCTMCGSECPLVRVRGLQRQAPF